MEQEHRQREPREQGQINTTLPVKFSSPEEMKEFLNLPSWQPLLSKHKRFCNTVAFYLPLCFTFCIILFSVTTYYLTYIIPLIQADYYDTCCYSRIWESHEERSSAQTRGILYACIMGILGILQIISTIRVSFTDPGVVPADWDLKNNIPNDHALSKTQNQREICEEIGEQNPICKTIESHFQSREETALVSFEEGNLFRPDGGTVQLLGQNIPKLKICSSCLLAKPPRAHHCRICNSCIRKMDHHCPWISNCVGFRNYKYFIMLLFYSGLALYFIFFTYWEKVSASISNSNISDGFLYIIFMEFFLSIFLGSIVFGFAILHLWMISHNLTTIEYCELRDLSDNKNLYSVYFSTSWNSFKAVFGSNPFTFFLPFNPNYEGNGFSFQKTGGEDKSN